ncbi:unnamed protein product [Meloidogyne enterolobii]|uniref:Uncharacterized protein n=1 Tax=Meloidogyne enterolobii TaxID=390850 RepID=A0ACB0XXF5_MELEN
MILSILPILSGGFFSASFSRLLFLGFLVPGFVLPSPLLKKKFFFFFSQVLVFFLEWAFAIF